MDAQIGVIGIGTMGGNLARNFASKGFKTAMYDRDYPKTKLLAETYSDQPLIACGTLRQFVDSLTKPRKIILLVNAGSPVDAVIKELIPLLSTNDIIIDGGNSLFTDTIARTKTLTEHNIQFIGLGISGGEEGALHGPSMMGGEETELKVESGKWRVEGGEELKGILGKVAARDFQGNACLGWFGGSGSGHYVKMVHNGIEYGIMQLIAETYQILRKAYRLPPNEIADIFHQWQKGKLNSFLIDITAEVLNKKDDVSTGFLIDHIKDQAGQKGTGQWTVQDAFTNGIPIPSITTAVEARQISSFKQARLELANLYPSVSQLDSLPAYDELENMLFSGIVLCYIQGLTLITTTAKERSWDVDLAEVVRIWQGGCIIRATLLTDISNWVKQAKEHVHLLALKEVHDLLSKHIPAWKKYLTLAMDMDIPLLGYQGAYQYFLSMKEADCSANLIQGLRDKFGAHTYERTDKNGTFHTNW